MARTLKTILTIDMAKFKAGLNNAKASVAGFDKSLIAPLGNMIKKVVRLGLVVGALAAAFAVFGVKAAAGIQSAQLRLAGISAGVDDFRSTWKSAYEVFIKSPLELDEAVKSMITLKNAGVATKTALEAVAAAAMSLGRPTEEIALSLLSMESKTLKRLGFAARSIGTGTKTRFEIAGIDKSGNRISAFADNIEDARKNLIRLLEVKYGGVLEAQSRTLEGVMSTFRGVRQFAFFTVFQKTLETLSPLIMFFNAKLQALAESGSLARFGERIAQFVIRAIAGIHNLIKAVRSFSLREWVMDNIGNIVAFGSMFSLYFGVKAVSAVMALIAAIKLLPPAMATSLGIISALAVGWNLGKLLDRHFDISHHVAKFMLHVKAMAGSLHDFFTGKGDEAMGERWKTLDDEIATLERLKAESEAKKDTMPDWMTEAFAKFKPVSAEELAAMAGAGGEGMDMPEAEPDKSSWRNVIDESARRGIGKIFGGGALGGGTEEKRTKAALAMVKRQGTTNELLEQVVRGVSQNNRRIGALAF